MEASKQLGDRNYKSVKKPAGQLDGRLDRIINTEASFGMTCIDAYGTCELPAAKADKDSQTRGESAALPPEYARMFNEVIYLTGDPWD